MSIFDDIMFGQRSVPSWTFDAEAGAAYVGPNHTIRMRVTAFDALHGTKLEYNTATRKNESGDPLWWVDGKPVAAAEAPEVIVRGVRGPARPYMLPVLQGLTACRNWEGVSNKPNRADDGERRVVCTSRAKPQDGSQPLDLQNTVKAALREANVRTDQASIDQGIWVEITCFGSGKAQGAANPPKLFRAKFWANGERPDWAAAIEAAVPAQAEPTDPNVPADPWAV